MSEEQTVVPVPPLSEQGRAQCRRSAQAISGQGARGTVAVVLDWAFWAFYLPLASPLAGVASSSPAAQPISAARLKPRYLFSVYGMQEPAGVASRLEATASTWRKGVANGSFALSIVKGKELFSFATTRTPRWDEGAGLPGSGMGQGRFMWLTGAAGDRHLRRRRQLQGRHPVSFSEGWSPLGLRFNGDELLLPELTAGQHRVLQLDKEGKPSIQFGKEGRGAGELWFPTRRSPMRMAGSTVSDRATTLESRSSILQGNALYAITALGLHAAWRSIVAGACT